MYLSVCKRFLQGLFRIEDAKMDQDYLFFGVDSNVSYCYRMLHLSHLVEKAKNIHGLNSERALLLSDSLLGCVLLSSILDYDERVNLRIQCNSDFTIGTETTFQAETKGYIECNDESSLVKSLDEGKILISELQVRSLRSQRNNKGLFEGLSTSRTQSIEVALNEHLQTSFQMNTVLKLSSWVNEESGKIEAFGVIFHELPDISVEVSEKLKKHIESLPPIKDLFLENDDADELAKKLIPDETKAIKNLNPKLVCSCSQQAVEGVLLTLPISELQDIINKSENVELKCHYCSKSYVVGCERVMEMYASRSPISQDSSEMN